jgi:hypothetical protein
LEESTYLPTPLGPSESWRDSHALRSVGALQLLVYSIRFGTKVSRAQSFGVEQACLSQSRRFSVLVATSVGRPEGPHPRADKHLFHQGRARHDRAAAVPRRAASDEGLPERPRHRPHRGPPLSVGCDCGRLDGRGARGALPPRSGEPEVVAALRRGRRPRDLEVLFGVPYLRPVGLGPLIAGSHLFRSFTAPPCRKF